MYCGASVVVLLAMTTACSAGSSSDDASCGGTLATEGPGWNLGRAPLDPDAAARAALFLASCVPDDNLNITLQDFYAYRSSDSASKLDLVACLAAKSNGCQAVSECAGITATFQGSCAAALTCHGNTVETCDDTLEFSVDCTKLGMRARCVDGAGCVPCDGATCDDDTFTEHCDAGRPVQCDNGFVKSGLRCSDVGLECLPDPFGDSYACFGTGPACQTNVSGSGLMVGTGCSGTRLEACVGESGHGIECVEVGAGFSCQMAVVAGETSYFCGLGAECNAGANPAADPTCDGSSVVMCNAGRIQKVDCVALGFTGCAPEWGRCVPGPYAEI